MLGLGVMWYFQLIVHIWFHPPSSTKKKLGYLMSAMEAQITRPTAVVWGTT